MNDLDQATFKSSNSPALSFTPIVPDIVNSKFNIYIYIYIYIYKHILER